MEWYQKPLKSIAVNLWSPKWCHDGILNLDIPALAEKYREMGIEAVFLWQGFSQDHFGMAYYPTTRGPRHPNLAPGRDHMREVTQAMHAQNIRVIAYYSYKDYEVWSRETDWRQVDAEGNAYLPKSGGGGTGRFGELCPNSPYHDYVVARQAEVAEQYDIDAICLLDSAGFYRSPCYCRYCRAKYRARYGRDIPAGTPEWTPEWEQYLQWKALCMQELYDDLKQEIRRIKPALPLTHLAFGCRTDGEAAFGMNFEKNARTDDFVNSITQWNEGLGDGTVHRDPRYQWITSLTARYLCSMSGKPVYLHLGRFTYDREFQSMPEHELAVSAAAAAAAGAIPSLADNLYPDGRADEQALAMIGRVLRKTAPLTAGPGSGPRWRGSSPSSQWPSSPRCSAWWGPRC